VLCIRAGAYGACLDADNAWQFTCLQQLLGALPGPIKQPLVVELQEMAAAQVQDESAQAIYSPASYDT
jgi:hypothetical protein